MDLLSATEVISIESLTLRLSELAERASDRQDRFTDETERDVRLRLGVWLTVADDGVWCSDKPFNEGALSQLKIAHERASRAWSMLYNKEPEWLVRLGDGSYLVCGSDHDAAPIASSRSLADAWTDNTKECAEQRAHRLRTRHGLIADVVMKSGAEMQEARIGHRKSHGPRVPTVT